MISFFEWQNPIKDGTQGLAPSNYLAIESDVYDLPKKHFDMDNLYDQLPCRRDSPEQPYDILPNRKIEDVYDLPRAIVKPDTSDEDYDELPVRRVGFKILFDWFLKIFYLHRGLKYAAAVFRQYLIF